MWEPLIERIDGGTRRWNLELEVRLLAASGQRLYLCPFVLSAIFDCSFTTKLCRRVLSSPLYLRTGRKLTVTLTYISSPLDEDQPAPGQESCSRRRLCHAARTSSSCQHLFQRHHEHHHLPKQPERLPQPRKGTTTTLSTWSAAGDILDIHEPICVLTRHSLRAPAPPRATL